MVAGPENPTRTWCPPRTRHGAGGGGSSENHKDREAAGAGSLQRGRLRVVRFGIGRKDGKAEKTADEPAQPPISPFGSRRAGGKSEIWDAWLFDVRRALAIEVFALYRGAATLNFPIGLGKWCWRRTRRRFYAWAAAWRWPYAPD